MGRQARLIALLAIDTSFFFLEITVGYAVGSLALVADSFHMLNDVISLLVALWALRLSKRGGDDGDGDDDAEADPRFSYGWQRAEVLGALVNGVFLLALCFSIFMEAIQHFFNIQEVANPRLVVTVGSLGLLSNIVGLFLFHDHGHSHGGHSHSHGHSHAPKAIDTSGDDDHHHAHAHGNGNGNGHSHSHSHSHAPPGVDASTDETTPLRSHDRHASLDTLYGHPAQTRAQVVQTAADLGYQRHAHAHTHGHSHSNGYGTLESHGGAHDATPHPADIEAAPHSHDEDGHSHGHSHGGEDGAMNMRGVFLHVMGDALGNVGVIASGLFILLSDKWWRFYTDPAISFALTVIIFHSALPLVKSASFILLQGVPNGVRLDQVKRALLRIPGVIGVHELHIWQLSESKLVASVHLHVDCSAGQIERYHQIASQVKQVLHRWGVHSSTIQPEFVPGVAAAAELGGIEVQHGVTDDEGRLVTPTGEPVEDAILKNDIGCLLVCNQGAHASCNEQGCCPTKLPSRPPSFSAPDNQPPPSVADH